MSSVLISQAYLVLHYIWLCSPNNKTKKKICFHGINGSILDETARWCSCEIQKKPANSVHLNLRTIPKTVCLFAATIQKVKCQSSIVKPLLLKFIRFVIKSVHNIDKSAWNNSDAHVRHCLCFWPPAMGLAVNANDHQSDHCAVSAKRPNVQYFKGSWVGNRNV